MTRSRKRSLILGILVLLACVLAATRASAQGNDLINAAKKGDLPRVKALIASGVDVNARDDGGMTALMNASRNGHLDVVLVLLAAKAEVNAEDYHKSGTTALMYACGSNRLAVVQTLLANGADVNEKANDGWTALMTASSCGYLSVVEALLAKGADVNAKEKSHGWTALKLAPNAEVEALLVRAGAKE
ncbi:MAG TPA: ankyrin repeat domain-containing protein [Methylomirabilota bacterium]|jgi:ankyrin repeat protein|nr:ankyrin repeat domain-containing protein [Methylomirabilota bacterium]